MNDGAVKPVTAEAKRERDLLAEVARLTRERDEARATNARLNRRCQLAECAAADAKRCLDKVNNGAPWCNGSLGRALLAWNNTVLTEKLGKAEAVVVAAEQYRDADPMVRGECYRELCERLTAYRSQP